MVEEVAGHIAVPQRYIERIFAEKRNGKTAIAAQKRGEKSECEGMAIAVGDNLS
jgi:hypothetical protein